MAPKDTANDNTKSSALTGPSTKTSALISWSRSLLLSPLLSSLNCLQSIAFSLLHRLNFSHPIRRLPRLADRQGSVIRCKIVGRWKSRLTRASSTGDFLLWSQRKLVSLDSLLEPGVSLYCVTSDLVVFVKTPPIIDCYRAATSPFFYMAQFLHAQEAYVTSHRWLHALASDIAEERRVAVTWLSSTGRCGSTMLCQVMEGVDGTVCISEPDAVLNIVTMKKSDGKCPEYYLGLLKSVITVLIHYAVTHAQQNVDHVFIKTRSECSVLIPDIHTACPHIRHVFLYRRLPSLLQSMKQLLASLNMPCLTVVNSDVIAGMTSYFRRIIFLQNFFGTEEEKESLKPLIPELNYLGILAAMVCSQLKMVARLREEGFPIATVLYKDIIADPSGTVGSLLENLRLPRHRLSEALASLSKRSQRNVPGFTPKGPASRCRLTVEEQRQVDRVVAVLKLHDITGDMQCLC